MVTTNVETVYRKLMRLRSHGINKLDDDFLLTHNANDHTGPNPWYYEMQELGFHYRITDIQSALAVSQMKRLDTFIEHRKALAARYDQAFCNEHFIRPAQAIFKTGSGNHIYTVRIDFEAIGKTRRQVMLALREKGVGTQVHYIPVPMHPLYQRLGHKPADHPQAMSYYSEALTIPLSFSLSFDEQDFVLTTLRGVLRG